MVIIGVDPHKRTHTASAVEQASGKVLAALQIDASMAGYRQLLKWASSLDERRWAVENARGLGRHLAQWLVARGERVEDVPSTATARIRELSQLPHPAARRRRRRSRRGGQAELHSECGRCRRAHESEPDGPRLRRRRTAFGADDQRNAIDASGWEPCSCHGAFSSGATTGVIHGLLGQRINLFAGKQP